MADSFLPELRFGMLIKGALLIDDSIFGSHEIAGYLAGGFYEPGEQKRNWL